MTPRPPARRAVVRFVLFVMVAAIVVALLADHEGYTSLARSFLRELFRQMF